MPRQFTRQLALLTLAPALALPLALAACAKGSPESEGNAVSQNNSFFVKWKPPLSRLTTTTLHNDHTENASISAGIEIHRFRLAIAEPRVFQKAGSSGSQFFST